MFLRKPGRHELVSGLPQDRCHVVSDAGTRIPRVVGKSSGKRADIGPKLRPISAIPRLRNTSINTLFAFPPEPHRLRGKKCPETDAIDHDHCSHGKQECAPTNSDRPDGRQRE